jgi:transposase
MPAPIENTKRLEIVQRHEEGESLRSISEEMGMSYETVKHIWQHWRREGRIEPNYERAKRQGTRKYHTVYEAAIALKQAHRRWGAALIRLKLEEDARYGPLPSVRTIQRWFRAACVQYQTPGSRQAGAKRVKRGQQPHEVWAVDAKEQIQLSDGSWASWLVISDEASGAMLATDVFPPAPLDAGERKCGPSQPEDRL